MKLLPALPARMEVHLMMGLSALGIPRQLQKVPGWMLPKPLPIPALTAIVYPQKPGGERC